MNNKIPCLFSIDEIMEYMVSGEDRPLYLEINPDRKMLIDTNLISDWVDYKTVHEIMKACEELYGIEFRFWDEKPSQNYKNLELWKEK